MLKEMRKRALLFTVLFLLSHVVCTAQDAGKGPDAVLGRYWTPTKNAKIEIYKEGAKYYGKTVWTERSGIDTLNPDPKKRNQSLLGLVFLTDFTYDDGKYVDGQIYDPQNGNIYSCKMWLEPDGDLKARGYIGISLFGRTEVFEKIEE